MHRTVPRETIPKDLYHRIKLLYVFVFIFPCHYWNSICSEKRKLNWKRLSLTSDCLWCTLYTECISCFKIILFFIVFILFINCNWQDILKASHFSVKSNMTHLPLCHDIFFFLPRGIKWLELLSKNYKLYLY